MNYSNLVIIQKKKNTDLEILNNYEPVLFEITISNKFVLMAHSIAESELNRSVNRRVCYCISYTHILHENDFKN